MKLTTYSVVCNGKVYKIIDDNTNEFVQEVVQACSGFSVINYKQDLKFDTEVAAREWIKRNTWKRITKCTS